MFQARFTHRKVSFASPSGCSCTIKGDGMFLLAVDLSHPLVAFFTTARPCPPLRIRTFKLPVANCAELKDKPSSWLAWFEGFL
jgi:hypothetical protein